MSQATISRPDIKTLADLRRGLGGFHSWNRLPGRESPKEPIPDLAPDLAVEVLSEGNTKAEMTRKVREYFDAGVILVWLIDPRKRTAQVFEYRELGSGSCGSVARRRCGLARLCRDPLPTCSTAAGGPGRADRWAAGAKSTIGPRRRVF